MPARWPASRGRRWPEPKFGGHVAGKSHRYRRRAGPEGWASSVPSLARSQAGLLLAILVGRGKDRYYRLLMTRRQGPCCVTLATLASRTSPTSPNYTPLSLEAAKLANTRRAGFGSVRGSTREPRAPRRDCGLRDSRARMAWHGMASVAVGTWLEGWSVERGWPWGPAACLH